MQTMEIDHQAEAEMVKTSGHDLDCWEQAAEEITEEAQAEGIELIGRHDETYRGMTIAERWLYRVTTQPARCHCRGTDNDEE